MNSKDLQRRAATTRRIGFVRKVRGFFRGANKFIEGMAGSPSTAPSEETPRQRKIRLRIAAVKYKRSIKEKE